MGNSKSSCPPCAECPKCPTCPPELISEDLLTLYRMTLFKIMEERSRDDEQVKKQRKGNFDDAQVYLTYKYKDFYNDAGNFKGHDMEVIIERDVENWLKETAAKGRAKKSGALVMPDASSITTFHVLVFLLLLFALGGAVYAFRKTQ